MTLGCADKLDILAMQIISAGTAGVTAEPPSSGKGMAAGIKIHELSLKLKSGNAAAPIRLQPQGFLL